MFRDFDISNAMKDVLKCDLSAFGAAVYPDGSQMGVKTL